MSWRGKRQQWQSERALTRHCHPNTTLVPVKTPPIKLGDITYCTIPLFQKTEIWEGGDVFVHQLFFVRFEYSHVYTVYIGLKCTFLWEAIGHIYGSLSFFTLTSPANIVAISPCMNAQGTLEPTRGHFSPLGQYTSPVAPCALMLSREQGKQNLWLGTDGHWTKWVSSKRSWQMVQHRGPLLAMGESGMFCAWTWSMPECALDWEGPPDRLSSPFREAKRLCPETEAGETGLLLLCLVDVVEWTELLSFGECALPNVSATDMSAAIGDCPFWGVDSGGVARLEWTEWPGPSGGGAPCEVPNDPDAIVSFNASLWLAIHCCLCCSCSDSFSALSAESGSGEALRLRTPILGALADGKPRGMLTKAVGSNGQLASM